MSVTPLKTKDIFASTHAILSKKTNWKGGKKAYDVPATAQMLQNLLPLFVLRFLLLLHFNLLLFSFSSPATSRLMPRSCLTPFFKTWLIGFRFWPGKAPKSFGS